MPDELRRGLHVSDIVTPLTARERRDQALDGVREMAARLTPGEKMLVERNADMSSDILFTVSLDYKEKREPDV